MSEHFPVLPFLPFFPRTNRHKLYQIIVDSAMKKPHSPSYYFLPLHRHNGFSFCFHSTAEFFYFFPPKPHEKTDWKFALACWWLFPFGGDSRVWRPEKAPSRPWRAVSIFGRPGCVFSVFAPENTKTRGKAHINHYFRSLFFVFEKEVSFEEKDSWGWCSNVSKRQIRDLNKNDGMFLFFYRKNRTGLDLFT